VTARRSGEDAVRAVAGTARVDRRTKRLLARVRPGEVAVIDHADLDRVAAEGLVEAHVAAVVNAAPSITGRYPNVGPLLVAAAGIPLVDCAGPAVVERIRDGDLVRVEGDLVLVGDEVVARGRRQDLRSLEAQLEAARRTMSDTLGRFAENTLDFIRREGHLLTESPDLPDLGIDLRGRHVLVVVRGNEHREDLAQLKGTYVRELRPVLIGVDGGADALLAVGLRPDVIIGDFDSASEAALRCGARLVVHAYPDGRAPGAARLDALGLPYVVMRGTGTSEDMALLLAYEKGAELIVAVGTHVSMVDFLDKGREGMASTFLVRLRVSDRLVDARGVNRLYASRVRRRDLLLLVAAALATMLVIVGLSPALRLFLDSTWDLLR
jgi:uncharacterized membrane-anchored protein